MSQIEIQKTETSFCDTLSPEEIAQLEAMTDPDAPVAAGDDNALKISADLQRNIVSMIVSGQDRDFLSLINPNHFTRADHQLIVKVAQNLKATCGGLPSLPAIYHEIRKELHGKPEGIVIDYLGEVETCRQFYLPGIHDEAYLRTQVVQHVKNCAVLATILSARDAIRKNGSYDTITLKADLAKAEAIATGGVEARSFVDANEVMSWPDPKWLIEGVMVENAFGMVYGLPGCMKTFLALDLALSLAHGLPFLNHFPVADEVPVAYITPEGTAGLKSRLQSWMQNRGIERLRNTIINRHAFRLNDPEEAKVVIDRVMAAKTKPRLLVIDTLARNFGGGDENSTKDMNSFVNNVMDIVANLDLAVLVVHHSGKDTAKGARGSIALTGGVDFSIEMEKPTPGRAVVRCKKQKDAAEFESFTVEAVPLGNSLALSFAGEANEKKADSRAVTTEDFAPYFKNLEVPKAVGEIAKDADVTESKARRAVDIALKHEWIQKIDGKRTRDNPNRYVLTSTGRLVFGGENAFFNN